MARPKRKNDFSDMFYQDHLNEADKAKISKLYTDKEANPQDLLENILAKDLSVKITWSDYNDAYSIVVTPVNSDHPAYKTYYSTFHADWLKALFVADYLLKDRYDYGDWTKGSKTRLDSSW